MSGPRLRDYHPFARPTDYAMTDPIAERIRKTGGSTLRSIGHITRVQRIKDNDAEYVEPLDMLAEHPQYRHRQLDRKLDGRDRTPYVAFIRIQPAGRLDGTLHLDGESVRLR